MKTVIFFVLAPLISLAAVRGDARDTGATDNGSIVQPHGQSLRQAGKPNQEETPGGDHSSACGHHVWKGRGEKITICHSLLGKPGRAQTIEINPAAWPAHRAHGDTMGPCHEDGGTTCDEGSACVECGVHQLPFCGTEGTYFVDLCNAADFLDGADPLGQCPPPAGLCEYLGGTTVVPGSGEGGAVVPGTCENLCAGPIGLIAVDPVEAGQYLCLDDCELVNTSPDCPEGSAPHCRPSNGAIECLCITESSSKDPVRSCPLQ